MIKTIQQIEEICIEILNDINQIKKPGAGNTIKGFTDLKKSVKKMTALSKKLDD